MLNWFKNIKSEEYLKLKIQLDELEKSNKKEFEIYNSRIEMLKLDLELYTRKLKAMKGIKPVQEELGEDKKDNSINEQLVPI